MEEIVYAKDHPEFITVTCLEWTHVLAEDRFKDIVIDSLRFLTKEGRISVYAFVLMSNHFHMIWQMCGDHRREDVQRDFLKYTGQRILNVLRNENSAMLDALFVDAKDRKYQVWERNSLGVPLWSGKVLAQELEYIHNNPVKAGLCTNPEDYKYSSARFYEVNEKDWDFLTHHAG